MIIRQVLSIKPGAITLMALMAATRFEHFGTAIALPDASLAVFFLAGMWMGGGYLFLTLLLEAGLIDYLSITQFGVSDFCISQAYLFLIPTYAAMWWGGKISSKFPILSPASAVRQFMTLFIASTIAFVISNGSFFLVSGRFSELSWEQYSENLTNYYPPYLLATLIYVVVIFAVVNAIKTLPLLKSLNKAV